MIHRREFRPLVIYSFFLFIFFFIETGIVLVGGVDDIPIGRIGYLTEAMSDNRHAGAVLHQDGRPYGLNDFLTRLLLVPKYNLLLLALFFLGILFLFFPTIRREVPDGIWLFFYGAIIYLVAIMFLSSEL